MVRLRLTRNAVVSTAHIAMADADLLNHNVPLYADFVDGGWRLQVPDDAGELGLPGFWADLSPQARDIVAEAMRLRCSHVVFDRDEPPTPGLRIEEWL